MRRQLVCLAIAAIALASPNTAVQAEDLFAVTDNNQILTFDSATPGITSGGAITGLSAGENIVGLDYRANGGNIYAVSDADNFYTINQNSFAASLVGALSPTLDGSSYAYDYNPVAAGGILSRIISADTNTNRVLDSTTGGFFGTPVDKTPVFYGPGDVNEGPAGNPTNPNIQGIAYNGNTSGSSATQQYGIDPTLGVVVTVANNAGTLGTVGSLFTGPNTPLLSDEVTFDISGSSGDAFATLQTAGLTSLYSVDLTTGAATPIGLVGTGTTTIRGLTAVPTAVPEPSSLALVMTGLGALLTRRRRNA